MEILKELNINGFTLIALGVGIALQLKGFGIEKEKPQTKDEKKETPKKEGKK